MERKGRKYSSFYCLCFYFKYLTVYKSLFFKVIINNKHLITLDNAKFCLSAVFLYYL